MSAGHGENEQQSAFRRVPRIVAHPSSSTPTPTPPPPAVVARIPEKLRDTFYRQPPPAIVATIPDHLVSSTARTSSAPTLETPTNPPVPGRMQPLSFSSISSIDTPPSDPIQPSSTTMGANISQEAVETLGAINAVRLAANEAVANIKRAEQEAINAIHKAHSGYQQRIPGSFDTSALDEALIAVPLTPTEGNENKDENENESTQPGPTTTPTFGTDMNDAPPALAPAATPLPTSPSAAAHDGSDSDSSSEWSPAANKPTCFCAAVPQGKMVVCDGDACSYRWFHATCLGMSKRVLKRHGARETDWLCAECKGQVAKGELRDKYVFSGGRADAATAAAAAAADEGDDEDGDDDEGEDGEGEDGGDD